MNMHLIHHGTRFVVDVVVAVAADVKDDREVIKGTTI